jgi:hypothetical protein
VSKILELYGLPLCTEQRSDWGSVVSNQFCPYLDRRCEKTRKSAPEVTIGTCSVEYGREHKWLMICPHRFLERSQVFLDCLHLLTLHEPGNELHIVPEVGIPGGSVDYFLASAVAGKVKDFVGIELQTLDTTGSIWPERQQFLSEQGIEVGTGGGAPQRFGMNWKMTAKTTLMQIHHEVETLEGINKHLVLVVQNELFAYMRRQFQFEHVKAARLGDPVHIHSYRFSQIDANFCITLDSRYSTDSDGIATSLGLSVSPKVELQEILAVLESKISPETRLVLHREEKTNAP